MLPLHGVLCLIIFILKKKTDENINGIPVITSIKRDASATMNIGSKNNKFNCLYVNAIHMGGHTYTSLNSGGGKIASYKATASQVNYNDDPKVETSVNTAGDTLTFKFSIPKGKDGIDGKDGVDGTRGPRGYQGDPGPAGPQGPQGEPGSSGIFGDRYGIKCVKQGMNIIPRTPSNGLANGKVSLGTTDSRFASIWCTQSSLNSDSDINLKQDIKSYDENIEKAYMEFRGVSYKFKNFTDTDNHDRVHYGFISQEIEQTINKYGISNEEAGFLLKDKLDEPNEAGQFIQYGLRYGEFISLNTHMTQKAHHRIDDLEKSLTTALSTIETLKQEIETLKQAIA